MGWLGDKFSGSQLQRSLVGCFQCGRESGNGKRFQEGSCLNGSCKLEFSMRKEVEVHMDEGLWSTLPLDILDRVLAHLPIPALFRMRLVCKSWKDLSYARHFLQLCSESPSCWEPCLPVFFISDGEELSWSAFDFSSRRWQLMPPPLPALGSNKDNFHVRGAGGLLCIGMWGKQEIDTLIVCNPVIGHWCSIPPPSHKWRPSLIQLVASDDTKGYKIILAGDLDYRGNNIRYRRTEIYDSLSYSWAQVGDLPPNTYMGHYYGVILKGTMYCIALGGRTGQELAGVLSFDVQQGVWQNLPYLLPKQPSHNIFLREACVAECRGKVVVVLEEISYVDNQFQGTSLTVHELNPALETWTKVGVMPPHLTYHLYENNGVGEGLDMDLDCVGHGERLCFINKLSFAVVVYNATEHSWLSLPNFDDHLKLRGNHSDVHSMGFSFKLSLLASVKHRVE